MSAAALQRLIREAIAKSSKDHPGEGWWASWRKSAALAVACAESPCPSCHCRPGEKGMEYAEACPGKGDGPFLHCYCDCHEVAK